MKHLHTRTRLLLVGILLFAVVICTSYLQTVFHFDTYLALTICLLDTIIAAMLLLG